jgi:hypothetical protein
LPEVEDSELAIVRQVYRLCRFPLNDSTVNDYGCCCLSDLELEPLLCALCFIASQYKDRTDTKGKLLVSTCHNAELHALFKKAFLVFAGWPDSFFSFLDWRKDQDRGTKYVRGLRKDFKEYRNALYVQLSFPSLDFMRNAFAEYLSTRWYGGYTSRIKHLGGRGAPTKYVSRLVAAARLRVAPESVDELIKAGKLTGVVQSEPHCRRFLIKADSIDEYVRALDDQIGLKEATRLLGLGPLSLMRLVEQGCLRPVRGPRVDGFKLWKFSRKDIDQLLRQFESKIQSSRRGPVGKTISFNRALLVLSRFTGADAAWFVRAILGGEISPSGRSEQIGIPAFFFSQRMILEYSWKLRRGPKEEFLCIPEAAKVLKLQINYVYVLVRKGILSAECSNQQAVH